ncbi:MAG: hypothetical protein HY735_36315 [Verrucomicrobia bacterium]|nr:hypothetical protein [Verrucomicrobiota bacterium]
MPRPLGLLFCLWLSHSAGATLVTPLSIQELTTRAHWIVHGAVLTKSCQRDPEGRIYTKVELQVKDVWKGTPSTNPLTIVHGGGTLGEERVVISGQVEYNLGEEVVAFLVLNSRGEAVTIGMAQGKFHVWRDEATGKVCVRNPFHGGTEIVAKPRPPDNAGTSTRLTLSTLKARVKGEEK